MVDRGPYDERVRDPPDPYAQPYADGVLSPEDADVVATHFERGLGPDSFTYTCQTCGETFSTRGGATEHVPVDCGTNQQP